MAASKPISWLYMKNTPLVSLNNNFGTLNSCSGLFPFGHTTLAYYVWLFNIYHSPSESKYSPIKSSRSPDMHKMILLPIYIGKIHIVRDHNSVPAMMFFWMTYLYRFRGKPAILVSFIFHQLTTILRISIQR